MANERIKEAAQQLFEAASSLEREVAALRQKDTLTETEKVLVFEVSFIKVKARNLLPVAKKLSSKPQLNLKYKV